MEVPRTQKHRAELMLRLSKFSQTTRLWVLNGHTEEEIEKTDTLSLSGQRPTPDDAPTYASLRHKEEDEDADEEDGLPDNPVEYMKIGRNEPCPCNSGKKYKKCCGA